MTTASRRTTSRGEGDASPQVLDLDGPRVLVADDQPDVLEALRLPSSRMVPRARGVVSRGRARRHR
jgi:hypothetical protein